MGERYDTKYNIKLGGFQCQLEATCVSSHTDELWYNETLFLWMTIYIYIYIYIVQNDEQSIQYHLIIFKNLNKHTIKSEHLTELNMTMIQDS